MLALDSHTGGEPTRVLIDAKLDLGRGSVREKQLTLEREFDGLRKKTILEPRASDACVGALLCESEDDQCASGVIFFNTAGYLGMCGHGIIGVAATLAYLGKIQPGIHKFETPVGIVEVVLKNKHECSIKNVPSYRFAKDVSVEVAGVGLVRGDVAWGGNWFFLVDGAPFDLNLHNVLQLTHAATNIRQALESAGITGSDGAYIDHVEFFSPSTTDADCQNFVLCPGGAYDRSPCGTGTSAKIACLAADGHLLPGVDWVQESIVGSQFVASYEIDKAGQCIPTISGSAYVCAETRLIFEEKDPFGAGIS